MTTNSLVDRLEQEHQEVDSQLDRFLADRGDTSALLRAVTALRRHIYLEEEFVFPALPDPALAAPVFVMLREHAQMWRLLDSLELGVRSDSGDAAATAQLCRQLVVALQHHNLKEERIIYAATTATLPPEVSGRIEHLAQATREAPADWVCIKARN